MIRWGIVGPGAIAAGFADAMSMVDDGEITAVASRSIERAAAFGERFGIPTRYGDYAELAADPDVDVVYVATPHSRHEADALTALRAGKHVLFARSRLRSTRSRRGGWPRRPEPAGCS
jgi:predicted dehydrogenase